MRITRDLLNRLKEILTDQEYYYLLSITKENDLLSKDEYNNLRLIKNFKETTSKFLIPAYFYSEMGLRLGLASVTNNKRPIALSEDSLLRTLKSIYLKLGLEETPTIEVIKELVSLVDTEIEGMYYIE